MSDRPALPAELTSSGVLAIARGQTTAHVAGAVDHLLAVGVNCVELTLTMPGATAAIASLVEALGAAACIGAGTVLTADQALACIDAGARFLVAPSVVPDVVAVAHEAKVPCLPGAFTPSEIVAAWHSGAAGVKLFPASLGGPRYLRDIRAPLPDIGLIPTGGVRIDDIGGYISAGAVAVGLGSPLFGSVLDDGDFEGLGARARRAVAAVSSARGGY